MRYVFLATSKKEFEIKKDKYALEQTYSKMKIRVGLSFNQIVIYYEGDADITVEKLFDDAKGLYKAAFQYAYLAYIMYFGKPVNYRSIYLKRDGQEVEKYQFNVYTLINYRGFRKFDLDQLDLRKEINDYLFMTKENQKNNQYIALVNLLISRFQKQQVDRFSYLWRAYNAMYRMVSMRISYKKENKMIATIEKYQCTGTVLGDIFVLDRHKRGEMYVEFTRKYLKEFLEDYRKPVETSYKMVYESFLRKHNYPYDILTFVRNQMGYYFRCNLFHGSEIYAFMVFDEDKTYLFLRLINDLIEESIMSLLPKVREFIV